MSVKRIVADIHAPDPALMSKAGTKRRFFVRDPFGKLVNILAHR